MSRMFFASLANRCRTNSAQYVEASAYLVRWPAGGHRLTSSRFPQPWPGNPTLLLKHSFQPPTIRRSRQQARTGRPRSEPFKVNLTLVGKGLFVALINDGVDEAQIPLVLCCLS